MTDEKLNDLIEIQRGIRAFESLKSDFQNQHWVRIEGPSTPQFRLPLPLYESLEKWVDEQLADMKKRFEEG